MPVTLADIAREVGVSKMTVSRAINNNPLISPETRERVLEVARRMNYQPNQHARALATNRSYLIGVVSADGTMETTYRRARPDPRRRSERPRPTIRTARVPLPAPGNRHRRCHCLSELR